MWRRFRFSGDGAAYISAFAGSGDPKTRKNRDFSKIGIANPRHALYNFTCATLCAQALKLEIAAG